MEPLVWSTWHMQATAFQHHIQSCTKMLAESQENSFLASDLLAIYGSAFFSKQNHTQAASFCSKFNLHGGALTDPVWIVLCKSPQTPVIIFSSKLSDSNLSLALCHNPSQTHCRLTCRQVSTLTEVLKCALLIMCCKPSETWQWITWTPVIFLIHKSPKSVNMWSISRT